MTTPSTLGRSSRYLRTPVPVHFPEAELVPETKRHLEQRTALYQSLTVAFRDRALIGSNQFVYWDPTDPRQCLALPRSESDELEAELRRRDADG
jgi:hypothetical protein